jgi:hypothetical protein
LDLWEREKWEIGDTKKTVTTMKFKKGKYTKKMKYKKGKIE